MVVYSIKPRGVSERRRGERMIQQSSAAERAL